LIFATIQNRFSLGILARIHCPLDGQECPSYKNAFSRVEVGRTKRCKVPALQSQVLPEHRRFKLLDPAHVVCSIVFLAIQIFASHIALSQSPIILRDLTLIRDKTISNFDRSAITLSDGSTLNWDEVLKARLPQDTDLGQRQSEFDDFIKQIGLPLFRVKTRIQQGDWAGAGRIAGPIFDSVMDGSATFSNPDVEYLICLATMKARTGQGSAQRNRAGAVIPFLRALTAQPDVDQKTLAIVGTQRIADKREDVLSPDLLPVWFDVGQTQRAAEKIAKLAGSKQKRVAAETEARAKPWRA